jgi:hypothetical protein
VSSSYPHLSLRQCRHPHARGEPAWRKNASDEEELMKRNLRRRIFFGLIVAAAIVAIGSCSIPGPSFIRISNTSLSFTLSHVNITGHSSTNWGSDLLTPGVITPGNAQEFEVNPGFYDVWVTDTTPYDAYAYDVQVTQGGTTTLIFNGATLQ